MTLTLSELERIVKEAEPLVRDRTVLAFRDEGPETFRLLLEGEADRPPRILRLLLCARTGFDRVHLTPRPARRRRGAPRPTPFARQSAERLEGTRLAGMTLEEGDRVVHLRFQAPEGERWTLTAEVIGRHANLLLLDREGTVCALLRPFHGKRRTLDRGLPYTPPPPPEKARRRSPRPRFAPGDEPAWPTAPWSGAADAFYQELEACDAEAHRRRGLLRRIRRRLRREEERIKRLRAEAAEADRAEEWKRKGDLLQAHFHRLRRGMDAVEVEDLFDPAGGTVTLSLNPALDPRENVAACYRRYRKATAAAPRLRTLLVEAEEARTALQALVERLDRGEDTAMVEAEAAAFLPATVPAAPAPARSRNAPRAGGARVFRTPEGFTVYVGRDGASSERLTFRFARGRDLWLHCSDRPGAHVIVRVAKGKSVPLRALLDAGLLAVHFSKLRGAAKAEVIYTPCKYIRRIKGAPPGKVSVERHKILRVEADPERLARLLDGARSEPEA